MNSFTVIYTIKYVIDFADNYVFNQYNEMHNLKTGRRKKKVSNNGTIGYIIEGKFYSLKQLRPHLKKPQKEFCPF
jgi:hypothetical protein